MKRNTPLLVAACLVAAGFTQPAAAQLDHLNVDRFIKEMREKGMSELIVRLAKSGDIKDPADAKKLEVEMLIMRAQTPVGGNPNDLTERIKALEDGMTQFQALIAQYRDSTKRPLWQADMALHLIYTRMALNNLADDFYEFGVPNADQTRVFESGAAIATEHLIDASTFLSRLQRELPRANDYNQTYVNTGRWEELMDEYLKTKVPFLLGQAAYMATLLPDSHPFYKNLGQNPNIPLQATNPAAERTRLLNLAVDSLSNIPAEMAVKYGLPARPMNLVKGKALARLGKYEEAIALFDGVAQQPKDDLLAFRAMLAKAVTLDLKAKNNPAEAVASLEALKDHPLTQGGIAFPIVITDLQHKLLLKSAGTDKKKIEAAYAPYDALFTDKRLGQRIEATRMFVYERWTKNFAGQKQDALPPMVLSGMGEMERLLGNEQVANWNNAKETKPEEAEKFMKEARVHLDKCIDICDVLIDRADVAPEVKARARYNKAYASYLKDPEDGSAFLRAAAIWTELANELPKHPLAEEAIGLAVRFLHNLHIQEGRSPVVHEAYLNTTAVLYSKLPETQVAEDERTYYTFNVLQSAGKYKEAAASYEKVSPQHRDYVEAQREWIYCQVQLWRQMPEAEKGARRDALRDEIAKIERIARKALEEEGDSARRQMFKTTLGDLVLTRVELDMHRKAWDDADRALRNFADDYPDEPDLIRLAIARRIMVQVKQGKSNEAVALAEQLMKEAGDDAARQSAAAGTIDAALAELAEEIEDLRAAAEVAKGELDKEEFSKRATQQAEASDKLADMLLKWATVNKVEEDQMFRYRLIKVRSSVLTGKRPEAETVLSDLAQAAPDEPRVIFLQGEVAFMGGKADDIKRAIGYYMKITSVVELTRITPQMPAVERNKAEVLNRTWWQSWLRILQCYDKLNAQTAQIPRIVAQLEAQHPELGGPGMRTKFQQLANKHRK